MVSWSSRRLEPREVGPLEGMLLAAFMQERQTQAKLRSALVEAHGCVDTTGWSRPSRSTRSSSSAPAGPVQGVPLIQVAGPLLALAPRGTVRSKGALLEMFMWACKITVKLRVALLTRGSPASCRRSPRPEADALAHHEGRDLRPGRVQWSLSLYPSDRSSRGGRSLHGRQGAAGRLPRPPSSSTASASTRS